MKTFVLFDVNYLCHRAMHSTGSLSHDGDATGVLYGVFRDIQNAREKFPTARFVFCFDHGKGIRETMYAGYKETRRKRVLNDGEAIAYNAMQEQIRGLKLTYLSEAGFNNVFFQAGYEGDDIIAAVCGAINSPTATTSAVIYSEDKDLYQLLAPNVSLYKPRTGLTYTYKQFKKDYGVEPKYWAKVKAIAGCTSDDVVGVPGVGEGFALKYVKGELPPTHKKYIAIRQHKSQWLANLPIVRLPLEGCKLPVLSRDEWSADKWEKLMDKFGISTLGGMPGGINKPKPLLKV